MSKKLSFFPKIGRLIKSLFKRRESVELPVPINNNWDNKLREEIIKSFLNQFTENQNHHQRIFIQFLSSVLVVIIAYVFVFTNTISPRGVVNNTTNVWVQKDTTKVILKTTEQQHNLFLDSIIKPDLYSAIKLPNGDIYSYSIKHLIGIYTFSEFVFIILFCMIVNMGYSFRRDLRFIYNIRAKYLSDDFMEIFGRDQFVALHKKWYNFLPSFNLNLCAGIFILQFIICISIFDFIKEGDNQFLNYPFIIWNKIITLKIRYLNWLLCLPPLISVLIYFRYYYVYTKLEVIIWKQSAKEIPDREF